MKNQTAKAAIADRYASALFDLACERDCVATIESDLQGVRSTIAASPDLRRFFDDPGHGVEAKSAVLEELFGKRDIHDLSRRFLALTARRRRLSRLDDIVAAFSRRAAEAQGITPVAVVSARELSDSLCDALSRKLETALGGKVALQRRVDPSLIGGLAVQIGSSRIDVSLKSGLAALRRRLNAASGP